MNDFNIKKQVVEIERVIDGYYDTTFRVQNEKCMPFIQQLVEMLVGLNDMLAVGAREKLQLILRNILQAMESKDYVLIRDYLHYELRAFILSIG